MFRRIHLFRLQVVWTVFLAAGILVTCCAALCLGRETAVYDGVIDEVSGRQLVLTVGREDQKLFRIEAGASVTLDGKPASIADLKPGFWASVTAIELEDTILIATDIQADSDVAGQDDGGMP